MGDHSFWTAVELVQWTGTELLVNTTEDYGGGALNYTHSKSWKV